MKQLRKLPDPSSDDFDKALKPYAIMVRPLISGASATLEVVGTKPLDSDEKESGTTAWSAFLYQYGAELDAKWLVLLWAAGIAAPRLAQVAKDKRDKVTAEQVEKERAKLNAGGVTQ